MKPFILILSLILIVNISKGQNPVTDTHPTATIFAIDYQTNLEVPVNSDAAILFKDAFIDLVRATDEARMTARQVPGQKNITIKQANPKIANGYQLTMQSNFAGRVSTVYSFLYNIDQNSLSFFDPSAHDWRAVQIGGENLNNLNNCALYARFNDQNAGQAPDLSVNGNGNGGAPDLSTDNTDAMDAPVTANSAPPELPDYEQPECPQDGDLWQPGYWAYSIPDHDYYWIPGVWVAPPSPGLLWTPPYWGYEGSAYLFHPGYWGPTVGFYGGINYGYGYVGVGFVGGEWRGSVFRYNTAVLRVNVAVVHNVYVNRAVIPAGPVPHVSFNGRGGIVAKPTPAEISAMHQQHFKPTIEQIRNQQAARVDRSQFARANMGRPANFARPQAPAVVPNGGANFSGRQGMQPQQRNQSSGNQAPANTNQGGMQRNASSPNNAAQGNQGNNTNRGGAQRNTSPGNNAAQGNPAGNNTRSSSSNGSRYYRPSDNGQSANGNQQQRTQQQNSNNQQQRTQQSRTQQQQRSQQQNRSQRPSRSDDSKRP